MDSLLKYKKYSILHILTQKPPTSVFVKMSKYAQWSYKWTVTVYIYTVTVHHVNDFFIHFFSLLSSSHSLFLSLSSHNYCSRYSFIYLVIRASTSVCAKKFSFCTSKTYFFYFTHLFLQNTYISLSIIHIYSNKIFIFLTL